MLFMSGRGWGKTRVGAEWLVWQALKHDKTRWSVVARTFSEMRDVCIEGESGLLFVLERYGVLKNYNRTLAEVHLTNGSRIKGYTAEKPDSIRGSNSHGAWCFITGTMIKTPSGDVPIESLVIGDMVMGSQGSRRVTATGNRQAELWTVTHERGELVGSAEHPIMTEIGWIPLSGLWCDDKLSVWGGNSSLKPAVSAGRSFKLAMESSAVSGVSTSGVVGTVYNLTVDGTHDYFANNVLVHNCDELSSWTKADSWDQLQFSLRLGKNIPDFVNQVVITTTPKPTRQFRAMVEDDSIVKVTGTLEENRENLTESFVKTIVNRYEGTRLWRQEGLGELLLDNPGALWTYDSINDHRVTERPALSKIVIAVDPATTTTESSDSTGIIVAGRGEDDRGYVLEDRTCKMAADGWAQLVIRLFDEYQANEVVVEGNQGGDAWEIILRQYRPTLPVRRVGAYQGKALRAEPVSALYYQGRVSHVGYFPELEDQQVTWVDKESDFSPDRIDALVHAMVALNVGNESAFDAWLGAKATVCPSCKQPNRLGAKTCQFCAKPITDEEPIPPTGFPWSSPK